MPSQGGIRLEPFILSLFVGNLPPSPATRIVAATTSSMYLFGVIRESAHQGVSMGETGLMVHQWERPGWTLTVGK